MKILQVLLALATLAVAPCATAGDEDPVVVVVRGESVNLVVVDDAVTPENLAQIHEAVDSVLGEASPGRARGSYVVTLTDPPELRLVSPSAAVTATASAELEIQRPHASRVGLAVMLIAGSALTTTGAILAAAGHTSARGIEEGVASGELYPFPGSDHPAPHEYDLYRSWQRHTRTGDVGAGLLVGGGALLGLSIPVGLLFDRRHRLGLTAAFRTRPCAEPGGGEILESVILTVSVR